jgi:hypothetical protein
MKRLATAAALLASACNGAEAPYNDTADTSIQEVLTVDTAAPTPECDPLAIELNITSESCAQTVDDLSYTVQLEIAGTLTDELKIDCTGNNWDALSDLDSYVNENQLILTVPGSIEGTAPTIACFSTCGGFDERKRLAINHPTKGRLNEWDQPDRLPTLCPIQ